MKIKRVSIITISVSVLCVGLIAYLYQLDHNKSDVAALISFVDKEAEVVFGVDSYVKYEDSVYSVIALNSLYRSDVDNKAKTLINSYEEYEEYLTVYDEIKDSVSEPIKAYINAIMYNDIPAIVAEDCEDKYEILYKALKQEGIENYYVTVTYSRYFWLCKRSVLICFMLMILLIANVSFSVAYLSCYYANMIKRKR